MKIHLATIGAASFLLPLATGWLTTTSDSVRLLETQEIAAIKAGVQIADSACTMIRPCQGYKHGFPECLYCSGTQTAKRCQLSTTTCTPGATTVCGDIVHCLIEMVHAETCNWWATTNCDWLNCTQSTFPCPDVDC